MSTVSRDSMLRMLLLSFPLWAACNGRGAGEVCELEDDLSPNTSMQSATEIDRGAITGGSVWERALHLCPYSEDWFRIEARPGQVLEVNLDFVHADGDVQLQLIDADGAPVVEALSITDGEYVRHTFNDSAFYYLRVFAANNAQSNAYTMRVAVAGEACEFDRLEPNDSANQAVPLQPGTYGDLSVCFGETDWYTLAMEDGQLLKLSATFDENAPLDLVVYRLGADGGLAGLVSSTPTATGAELTWRVQGVGPFVARAARTGSTVNANYELTFALEGESCVADAFEPNDTFLDAAPVTAPFEEEGVSLCVNDRDWYSIPVEASQLLQARISFEHAASDLSLTVSEVMPDGTVVGRASSNSYTDDEEVLYRTLQSATFLVNVAPSRGSTFGEYDILVDVLGDACVDDAYEPNNTALEAAPLADGDYAAMTLCVGDDDWYKFEADQGQIIQTRINFDHVANDLGLQIHRLYPDGTITNRINSDTLTNDEAIVYRPFESGDFLARVYRARGTQVATYTMSHAVDGDECVPDTHEPNNAYPDAKPITPGVLPNQSLCVSDADWYSFQAQNGQVIELDLEFNTTEDDLGLQLYKLNADGTVTNRINSDTLNTNESIRYQPFESGTFITQVYRARGTAVANYKLTLGVSGQGCVLDGSEPNDQYQDATAITPGALNNRTLCIGETDYYKFNAQNGQTIRAGIAFTHAQNDLGMQLYRLQPDGTLNSRAGSDTLTDNEQINYLPYDDGTFILYVYRTRGTTVAQYNLNLQVQGAACPADAFEPNDTSLSAKPLSNGDYEDLTLCVSDTDWYKFPARNAQVVNVEANFVHAENDLGIQLYRLLPDGSLNSRASSDSLTDNEWIYYRPFDDGDFVLNVFRSRGTQRANYDLSVQVSGTPCVGDAFEPNDHQLQRAMGLPTNGSFTTGLTSCVGDDDWYDIGVIGASVLEATARFTHADQDLALNLYALQPDGSVISLGGSDSLTDNEYVVVAIAAGSDYIGQRGLARVTRSRGTQVGVYDLAVKVTVP